MFSIRYQNFPVQMKVLGVEKSAGFVTFSGVKRKLGSAWENAYRSTDGAGRPSPSRLFPLTPLVGTRDVPAFPHRCLATQSTFCMGWTRVGLGLTWACHTCAQAGWAEGRQA